MEQVFRLGFAERFRALMLAHRDRLATWFRRHVVDYGPFGDEGHAVTRYELAREAEEARKAYKGTLVEMPGEAPPVVVDMDLVERAR